MINPRRQRTPRPLGLPSRRVRRSGQILVITLLAITLLAGLIFYVYNVGTVVNRRLEMQNAADSAAVSGAGWMARSMNVIALNNVTQARLIALVPVIDALPLACEMTIKEMQRDQSGEGTLWKGLENQLARGVPGTAIEKGDFLRNGLEKLYREMKPPDNDAATQTQMEALIALDEALNSDDEREPESGAWEVKAATHWNSGGGRGELWNAALALDAMSQATLQSAGLLAQNNAARFGRANDASVAFVVPVLPAIPAERGNFDHFESVLMDRIRVGSHATSTRYENSSVVNRLRTSRDVLVSVETASVAGGAIPDWEYPHRLGPFANLYRWRHYFSVGGGTSTEGRFRSGDPLYDLTTRGEPASGTYLQAGYRTYGPFWWAVDRITGGFGLTGHRTGAADVSRFAHHLRRVAVTKLAYMFGLPAPIEIQYAQFWITDYKQAKADGEDPDKRKNILRTQYYRAAVRSTVRWDSPSWLADKATYADNGLVSPFDNPRSSMWTWTPGRSVNSWWDIETRMIRPDERLTLPHVLRREWYTVKDANGQPRLDPAGNPIRAQRVVSELRFVQWERMGEYVWRVKKTLGVAYDNELGLQRVELPDQSLQLHTVYAVGWFVFRGCELRDPVRIANPSNFGGDALPAPILLRKDPREANFHDVAKLRWQPDWNDDFFRETYSFLGVARRSDRAGVWPEQFWSRNPTGRMLAVAQAKLFNNRSWDLWTQNWQTQLTPVTRWDDWVNRLEAQKGQADVSNGLVSPEDLEEAWDYMHNLPVDMMSEYLVH